MLINKTDVFIILALTAGVFAAPQSNPNDITIVKQEEVNNIGVGGYHFSYEQSDGQKREETAELKNEGTENESLSVVGSFSFVAPDGHTYRYASLHRKANVLEDRITCSYACRIYYVYLIRARITIIPKPKDSFKEIGRCPL
ncbi:hypothetical protein PUN28_007980 [Cardiocondyla obscurior]|uniref:Uncharacterized protein n=1 Tax=Cardiocondyla obscurior TaxID=286306 RepID=A0AAW2G0U0_9HYME